MPNFISESDFDTFEGWIRYQGIDMAALPPEQQTIWRKVFDDKQARVAATRKIGLMKLRPLQAGEHRYGVAVEDANELWLVLWIRRSPKGEFFVMVPRDSNWDPHTSYHLDGTFHAKSYRQTFPSLRKKQPLTGSFRGRESLGRHFGYGPKSVGAIADPSAFTGLIRLPPNVLGPRDGAVDVDLIEPGTELPTPELPIVAREIFREFTPWLVVTVLASS